jgi:hypothetical protein
MLQLYQQRLSTLEQTVAHLHEVIGNDQAIKLLGDK